MAKDPIGDFPESYAAALTNTGAQAGLGSIPVVGGALAPIVSAIITAPLEKRRVAWFNRIGANLSELESRFEGFDPSTLSENDDFVSAVYETTDAAMKASRETKRERLANVVLNIAAGRTLADALRSRFIGYVQTFSDEHVLLLRICDNPMDFPRVAARKDQMTMGSRSALFENELRAYRIDPEVIAVVTNDLVDAGMIDGGLNVMMSGNGLFSSSSTAIGKAFLQFISSPLDRS